MSFRFRSDEQGGVFLAEEILGKFYDHPLPKSINPLAFIVLLHFETSALAANVFSIKNS
jgi:hypothetical protein